MTTHHPSIARRAVQLFTVVFFLTSNRLHAIVSIIDNKILWPRVKNSAKYAGIILEEGFPEYFVFAKLAKKTNVNEKQKIFCSIT